MHSWSNTHSHKHDCMIVIVVNIQVRAPFTEAWLYKKAYDNLSNVCIHE